MNLLHGHYIVSVNRDMADPFQKRGLESLASIKLASVLVLAGVVFTFISLKQARHDNIQTLSSVAWAGISYGIATFVRANGRPFTNHRLLPRRI